MADRKTIETYDWQAANWVDDSPARDLQDVAWMEQHSVRGPVVDIGCGPGQHLPGLTLPAIGLDTSRSMLELDSYAPGAPRVRGSVAALPFAAGSLGGALANQVYQHLQGTEIPLAFGDLHRALASNAPAFLKILGDEWGDEFRDEGKYVGRLLTGLSQQRLSDICQGAGLEISDRQTRPTDAGPSRTFLDVP